MKTAQWKSMGLTVNLSVPESVEEFDANAKRAGACLDEAISNCVYRGSLAEFRDTLTEKVEEKYVVERLTKDTGKKDSDGKAILTFDETEADYIKRVLAEKGLEVAALQSLADEVASAIVFDASARERKAPTPKKLAQKWVDAAKTLLADDAKIEKFNGRCDKLISKSFTATSDTEKDVQALGALVREFVEENEKQQLAKLVG